MIRFNCPNCNRHYELSPALALLPLVCKQCGERMTPPAAEPEPPRPPSPPKPVAPPPPKAPLPVAQIVPPPPAKAGPVAKPPAPPVLAPTTKLPPSKLPSPKPPVPKPPLPPDDDDEDDGVLVTKPDSTPDIDFNVGGPTAASLSDANRTRPTGLSDANRPRPADLDSTPGSASVTEPHSVPEINLELLGIAPPAPAPRRAPKPPEPEAPPEKRPEPTLVPFIADLVVLLVLVVVGMMLGEVLAKKPTGEVLSEAGSAVKFPPFDLVLWAGPPVTFVLIYLLLGSRQLSVGAWLRRRALK